LEEEEARRPPHLPQEEQEEVVGEKDKPTTMRWMTRTLTRCLGTKTWRMTLISWFERTIFIILHICK